MWAVAPSRALLRLPAHPHLCHGHCCTSPDILTICRHCVCVASSRHFPCVCAVGLCVAWQTSAFLALWPSVSACVRARCSVPGTPFLALSFGGGAVTEVLHALRCGLALSSVRHDLPCNNNNNNNNKKPSAGIVCALLLAVTFPAFVQLACVLLGDLLHSLRCGRPALPAYKRAALSWALPSWPSPSGEAPSPRFCFCLQGRSCL